MATDETSLLLRIRGDSSGGTRAVQESRAAITQLRQSSVQDLRQIQAASTASLGSISQTVSQITSGVPVAGQAVNTLSTYFTNLSTSVAAAGAGIAGMAGPLSIAVAGIVATGAAVVALGHQLFTLAQQAADFQGKLFDLSQQTGVSVETLSALEVVAKTTGGSIEQITASLGIFQRNMEEATDENTKAAAAFRRLGVDVTNTEDTLRATLTALSEMPEGFRQTALALELFGRGGKSVLAILKETQGDLDGTIERLRQMGVVVSGDAARAADEFNDQLALLEFQLRGLGTQAIPVITDALRTLSRTLEENRDFFEAIRAAVQALTFLFVTPLKGAILVITEHWKSQLPVIRLIAETYERIVNALQIIRSTPLPPTTTPSEPAQTADKKDDGTKQIKEELEARKRLQGVLNQAFAESQRQAQARIAEANREFEAGRRNRQETLNEIIAAKNQEIKAKIDALEVERKIKLQEAALARDDVQKRTQLSNAIAQIDIQIADRRAERRRFEADERAKAERSELDKTLKHETAKLETLERVGQRRIALLEAQIAAETITRDEGFEEIERIENLALEARRDLLKRELEFVGVGPDRQAVLDKIATLEQDRIETEDRQRERRIQAEQEAAERIRDIRLGEIDTALQLQEIVGERLIASQRELAALRVKTEEDAAREILRIRLDLIDQEIEATRSRLQAAGTITDLDERLRVEAEHNARLKLLLEQRKAIQANGERDVEEGRRRDIDSLSRYENDLQRVQERIQSIDRDTARTAIELLILNFASRRDIIQAQVQFDIESENARHRNALQTISNLHAENQQIGRTKEERLEAEKQINALAEAEAERHRLALEAIQRKGRLDEKEASPLGRLDVDLDNLREFASVIEDSIVPLGEILTRTFQQVADAIGQTVQNWVLLGQTGPAVMRRILAQALASIAAEAAVNAIKELALGFATLFFNPAESAAHFTAAGLWASIGLGSALAGRAIAGDLFKPQTSGGGGAGRGGATGGRQETPPIDLVRTQQTQELHIFLHGEAGPQFKNAVINAVVDDVRSNGPMRTTVKEVSES